jgi:hypothetical protein
VGDPSSLAAFGKRGVVGNRDKIRHLNYFPPTRYFQKNHALHGTDQFLLHDPIQENRRRSVSALNSILYQLGAMNRSFAPSAKRCSLTITELRPSTTENTVPAVDLYREDKLPWGKSCIAVVIVGIAEFPFSGLI